MAVSLQLSVWPVSVRTSTTMSSTVSTVRSAVLNGVFSGTRSMRSSMTVIFTWAFSAGRARADALDAGHAVHVGLLVVEQQRVKRGERHAVEAGGHAGAVRAAPA